MRGVYEITVEARFSAAHRHPLPGTPAALHGHDFLVLVRLRGEDLRDDVVADFHEVETDLGRHLRELSHRDLSLHPELAASGGTPAALARWIHGRMALRFAAQLVSVEVKDGTGAGARFETAPGDPPSLAL